MDIEGKVGIITGGASGIGAALCRAFAAEGARVAVTDVQLDAADKLAKEVVWANHCL